MYNRNAGPVLSIASCEAGQSLVAATQESVFVLRYYHYAIILLCNS